MSQVRYMPIEGYPAYRVGDDGTVWSRSEILPGRGSVIGEKWKLLKGGVNRHGYRYLVLCNGKKRWTVTVHKLVLTLFVGPCPPGMEGCHFPDRDRGNNRLDNLRWDTGKGNAADRASHGTLLRGEKNPAAKLTAGQASEIRRRRKAGEKNGDLALEFGVSYHTVSGIARGIIWGHLADA